MKALVIVVIRRLSSMAMWHSADYCRDTARATILRRLSWRLASLGERMERTA